MTEPKRIKERPEYCKSHMRQFEQTHIKPALERVQAAPGSLAQEAAKLFTEAKAHFKSQKYGRPGNKEALCLFALERLDDLVNDRVIAGKVIGDWRQRGSQYRLARLILYPVDPWPGSTWTVVENTAVRVPVTEPGFIDYARSLARSSSYNAAKPETPPPPPSDPIELSLEAKVLIAEQELGRHKDALKAYRESKEKAARELEERERAAREMAEKQARERQAREQAERERVERESRERADRDRRAGRTSRHPSGYPAWAMVLNLPPPFTEERIRAAYRAKAKLTHPDLGGTDKEFREVDSAYDAAMRFCRSQGICAV